MTALELGTGGDLPQLEGALAARVRKWRRRSRLVRFWRFALPAGIVALVSLFAAQLIGRALDARDPERVPTAEIRIVNARFLGRDSRGRAFEMRAREAVRVPSDPGAVRLFDPRLTVNRSDGRPVTITATNGYWRDTDQIANMRGSVVLTDPNQGYVFRTEEAVADTRADTVTGSTPIEGEGPFGRISAQSYAIYDQGGRIVFSGQVRARLNRGARGLGVGQASSR